MPEIETRRSFQQRFLDGYDRSQLREEVEKVKPRRLSGLRKKYATWALGASLALGGLGVPMKMIQDSTAARDVAEPAPAPATALETGIAGDLQEAAKIADQVAGGVNGGMAAVAKGVSAAAQAPLQTVAEAPRALSAISESIKAQFFSKEIPFGSVIYSEAKKNDLPPELVAAVVQTESKFNPNARSDAGAVGLMQLVPRTGHWMGARNLLNPAENISAGAKYLRYLSDRFDGDQQKAIAAYNAGEGNVRRFNGVPPFRETREYVSRVRSFERDLGTRLANHADTIAMAAAQ